MERLRRNFKIIAKRYHHSTLHSLPQRADTSRYGPIRADTIYIYIYIYIYNCNCIYNYIYNSIHIYIYI